MMPAVIGKTSLLLVNSGAKGFGKTGSNPGPSLNYREIA
jgi:hypothetical protein